MDFYKELLFLCHSWLPHNCLAGGKAHSAPFCLLSAPCHRAEGKSRAGKALNVGRNEAVGSREAGIRLFTSPEHCGTPYIFDFISGHLYKSKEIWIVTGGSSDLQWC